MRLDRLDAIFFTHRSAWLLAAVAPLAWAALAAPAVHGGALAGGAVLVAGGAALRLWAVRWLGKRARVSRAKATVLVVAGPYAHVRNPLYLAAVLVLLGLGLMAGLATWALLPAAWALFVYDRAVRHEERALLAAHGDVGAAFLAAVPRWLPSPAPAAGVEVERQPWGQVLGREWRLVVGVPAAGLALGLLASPEGQALRGRALAGLEGVTGLPWPWVLVASVALGGVGDVLKTRHDLRRKARRRAAQAAAREAAQMACPELALVRPTSDRAAS